MDTSQAGDQQRQHHQKEDAVERLGRPVQDRERIGRVGHPRRRSGDQADQDREDDLDPDQQQPEKPQFHPARPAGKIRVLAERLEHQVHRALRS
ncbi:hypothetical protein GGQ61_001590 [Phenylobacterium haematophilum]|uniref:Uncharacterized protein n=1 Tax=Phenylobacterium haematophilum TaxID=98513 RepID=A0A839ZZQ6_9CAUL|nr:hypothetical protein [Phenylobacterium haematophilum]